MRDASRSPQWKTLFRKHCNAHGFSGFKQTKNKHKPKSQENTVCKWFNRGLNKKVFLHWVSAIKTLLKLLHFSQIHLKCVFVIILIHPISLVYLKVLAIW